MHNVPNIYFSRFITLGGSNSFYLKAKPRNLLALNLEIIIKQINIAAAQFQGGHLY